MKDYYDYNQLIQRILTGNREAYSEIFERTNAEVYKTVHFLIDDKSDVEDVVQEIYIQVYKSLNKFDTDRFFQPWLMGFVIKQIHAYRRKKWMHLRITKKAEQYQQGAELDFANDLVDKLSNADLVKLVENLSYKLKQVVILHYFNEYSQEDISEILDIPIGTVKSRINAALNKLRQKKRVKNIFARKVGVFHES